MFGKILVAALVAVQTNAVQLMQSQGDGQGGGPAILAQGINGLAQGINGLAQAEDINGLTQTEDINGLTQTGPGLAQTE